MEIPQQRCAMTTSSCLFQSAYQYKTKLDQPQVPLFSFGNTPSSSPDDIIKNLLSPSKEDGFSILAGLRRANTSPSPTRRRESREGPINIAPIGKEKETLGVNRSEQLSKEKDVVLPDRNASVSAEGSRGDYIRASISNQDPQSNDALNSGVSLPSQLSENIVQKQPLELQAVMPTISSGQVDLPSSPMQSPLPEEIVESNFENVLEQSAFLLQILRDLELKESYIFS